ncbi:MAG: hypothetical protein GC206_08470 [Alphaproteobacteria bacterium]|nr:hypothetical protein [Alphaproteobacteria bacterium]
MTPALARRLCAILAVVAGLGVLALTLAFPFLPEVKAAAACARATSLIEFQEARSMDALIAVFSAPGGQCRAPMVAAMDAQNTFDVVAYIPVYALFLVAAAAAFEQRLKSPLFLAAAGAVALAVAGDLVETLTQLRITDDVEASAPLIGSLASGYWLKYAGLAAYAAVLAPIAWRAGPRLRWLALVALLPPAAFIAHVMDLDPPMTPAFAAFWIALLVGCALLARCPQDHPATDHPSPAPGA